MDVNNIIKDLNTVKNGKYDEINKDYIGSLDVNSIFKTESKVLNDLNMLKEKEKNLDLIYFNYKYLKKKIATDISNKKDMLINISNQKDEFNTNEIKKKLLYLSKEYVFYKEQTNSKDLIERIKNLHLKIDMLKSDIKDRKLSLEYNKIKEKYNSILIFIKTENFDNKNENVPINISNEEKIKWYEKRIQEYIEKQMVFDNYLFMLENYYNDVLNKRILNSTPSKEPV